MSTAIVETPANTTADNRVIEYVPFCETKPIKLSLSIVRSHIAVPTRQGKVPSDSELMKFMMLCQARELNPWVGDAYLVGYDTQDGAKFSLITAIQSLLKRAEVNPNFDGLESGVIVLRNDEIQERQGDLALKGEQIVGAWARCYRTDRSHPFYESLSFATYNTGKSQWAKDPAGMIVKCAEASVLRKAFPSQVGSLYIEQERGAIERRLVDETAATPKVRESLATVTKTILKRSPVDASGDYVRTADESQETPADEQAIPIDPPATAVQQPPLDWDKAEADFLGAKTIARVSELLESWIVATTAQEGEMLRALADKARQRIRDVKAK